MLRSHRQASIFALLALIIALLSVPSLAQSDVITFSETGHTLRGAFRVFWEGNGGLETFGYPISEEYTAANGRIVQWFERSRFELAVGGYQPQVELGMLGIEATVDRIFPKVRPITNTSTHRYFAETGHIIKYGFKEVWETRGGLPIFGYPISEEINEIIDDGTWHTVQYFERARFEYWPDRAPGQRVLMTLLGWRLAPTTIPTPGPTTTLSVTLTPTSTVSPYSTATVTPTATPITSATIIPTLPAATFNNCQADPNPSAAPHYPIRIAAISKQDEFVTVKNVSSESVNLTGWHMCSITGNQEHPIGGILLPGEIRTYFGPVTKIWNNIERDDGALYNSQGQLVSYWVDN